MMKGVLVKTSMRLLVRREGKRGHEETTIIVDWAGCSNEDVSQMAAYYVMHRMEHDLKGSEHCLASSYEVFAKDYARLPEPPVSQREVPKQWKEAPHTDAFNKFTQLMETLTPEEVAILLRES